VKKAVGEMLKGKTDEMESKAMASALVLVENSGTLKLEDVLTHRVTGECLSIFNVNGSMRKVQKSKLQEKLAITPITEPDVYNLLSTWVSFGGWQLQPLKTERKVMEPSTPGGIMPRRWFALS